MKPNFEICLMKEENLNEVASISKESISSEWDEKQLLYELKENEFSNIYIIKNDIEIIGFIDFWITFDSSTICEIAVKKLYRKQGFAGKLMDFCINFLKNKEILSLTLEVRKSNVAAYNLYKKFGFSDVCIKPHYYKDGEDAIYMMRGIF